MEEPNSNTYPISGYFRRPSSVDFLFMQISKVAVPIVAALAVTAGGVVAATAQPTESKEWTVIGLTGSYAADGITITNPTNEELFCSLEGSGKKYIEPIFTPWNEPGTYYSKAERDSKAASNIFDRLTARKEINKWNLSHQDYIEARETRLYDWMVPAYASSPIPGIAFSLNAIPKEDTKLSLLAMVSCKTIFQ